jgi:hypothetical protein
LASGDVHRDDAGSKLCRVVDRLSPVVGFADDFDVAL